VSLSGVVGYGYQTSSAGVKGLTNTDMTFAIGAVEDLGGGLKASVATAFDTTGSTFGSTPLRRNSSIGLSGDFGAVSIINTRSSDLLTSAMVAPSYLPDGMYDGSGIVTRAAVDVLQYTLPAFSGVTPYVQYVEAGDGNGAIGAKIYVVGANYANGPLAAGVAYKNNSDAAVGTVKTNTFASGVAASDAAKSATSFGVSVPVGALTVGANYAKRGDAKVTEFAAKYDLSKRTALRFSSGKQSVDTNTQNRIALVHAF
jgi:predicted porin